MSGVARLAGVRHHCRMGKTEKTVCPVERTAEIVGNRWTALIMRDLLLNPSRRYQDFIESLSSISPNTLSDRLRMLEEHGIVERRYYEQHPPRAEYLLTEKGRALGPVIRAMRDWGQAHG